jgi:hypothetical protein
MKDVIRIGEAEYIFFDTEGVSSLYLPRIIALDLTPEEGKDIFIVKIINLVNPRWVAWPHRIGERTGYVRWFRGCDRL